MLFSKRVTLKNEYKRWLIQHREYQLGDGPMSFLVFLEEKKYTISPPDSETPLQVLKDIGEKQILNKEDFARITKCIINNS